MPETLIGYKPNEAIPSTIKTAEMPLVREKTEKRILNEIPVKTLLSVLPADFTSEEVEIAGLFLKY